jgi:hypothetical protein
MENTKPPPKDAFWIDAARRKANNRHLRPNADALGGLLSAPSRSSPPGCGRRDNRAMKSKLLEDAGHYDRLAAKADRAAEEAAGF